MHVLSKRRGVRVPPCKGKSALRPKEVDENKEHALFYFGKKPQTSSAICLFKLSSPRNRLVRLPWEKSISMEQSYLFEVALTILAKTSALVSSRVIMILVFMRLTFFQQCF
jgi:hypothetical protein